MAVIGPIRRTPWGRPLPVSAGASPGPAPTRTYAEFQTHIQGLATGGSRPWTANMGGVGKFYVDASSGGASGAMAGSTWGPSSSEGAQTIGSLSRGLQHAFADTSVYNQQISQSAQIYVEFGALAFSAAALPSVTRNGFTSSANASTGNTMAKIIDLIRWDFTLNKAFRSNPSAGTAETEYTW